VTRAEPLTINETTTKHNVQTFAM